MCEVSPGGRNTKIYLVTDTLSFVSSRYSDKRCFRNSFTVSTPFSHQQIILKVESNKSKEMGNRDV